MVILMCVIIQEAENSFFTDTSDPAYAKLHSTITDAVLYIKIICGDEKILIDFSSLSESTIAELYELKLAGTL